MIVHVNSQTCQAVGSHGSCSLNPTCKCLHLSFSDDVGICAVVGVTCSKLSPCQAPYDTCAENHICVRHPECGPSPLCYPLSMADQRLCPPMTSSKTTKLELFNKCVLKVRFIIESIIHLRIKNSSILYFSPQQNLVK